VPDISQFQALPVGLSDAEAAARSTAEDPSDLPRQSHRSVLRIAIDVLREDCSPRCARWDEADRLDARWTERRFSVLIPIKAHFRVPR
jgi:hypothetical protein